MMYRTVIWKNPDEVYIPNDVDRDTFDSDQTNAKTDFEENYKSQVTVIQSLKPFDIEIDYTTFKNKIDGQTITWSDVQMVETSDCYYLFLEVD